MAGDDDEIIVTIEPELDETLGTGDADVKVIEGRANEDPALDLKNQFTKMQGDLNTANQRITSAETEVQRSQRLLSEERERNKNLETEVIDTRKSTVEQGITAATAEADAAQADYERAFTDGDAAAAARAQRRMSQAEGRISRLTEAKDDLAATKPTPRKVEEQERRAAPSSDPVEQYVQGRSAQTSAWIRAHPDFVTDARKNSKLTAAHFDATGEGLSVDTPEYFAHVEKFLGIKTGEKPGNAQQQHQRRPGAPTAPGADVGGRNGGGPSTVKLSRNEANAATDGTIVWNYDDPSGKNRFKKGEPIGHAEFAKRKLAMEREGRYDRTYTEFLTVISQEAINELWRAGYTLTRRLDDPTNLSHKDIPNTRAYQWMHLVHDKVLIDGGWAPVPHSRHNGRFAPWGTEGNIEWQGLGLFEKPLFEVEAEQAANHAKAHQNVDDWAKKNAANGISGSATVGIQTRLGELDSVTTHKVGDGVHADPETKTIDTTVRIPRDMQPHIVAVLAERDRLSQLHVEDSLEVAPISQQFHEHMKANPDDPMWPTLHALMLPKAIENVRARLATSQEA